MIHISLTQEQADFIYRNLARQKHELYEYKEAFKFNHPESKRAVREIQMIRDIMDEISRATVLQDGADLRAVGRMA